MRSEPKQEEVFSSPCPQGCGFSLYEKDLHKTCPVCLGNVHARSRLLHGPTLVRRVKFMENVLDKANVAQQDPLLSLSKELAPSMSNDEEPVVREIIESWTDHTEFTDGLPEYEPGTSDCANQTPQGLDICHDSDNLLDIGLDIHGLSENEQEELSSDQSKLTHPSSCCAVAQLKASSEPMTVKNSLPMFLDFVKEQTSMWHKPLSTQAMDSFWNWTEGGNRSGQYSTHGSVLRLVLGPVP